MSRPKLPAFMVRATPEQAERWQAAAEYDGTRNVAAWLATLAAERLLQLGRSVPRMVLRWRRARFHVMRRPEMGDDCSATRLSPGRWAPTCWRGGAPAPRASPQIRERIREIVPAAYPLLTQRARS